MDEERGSKFELQATFAYDETVIRVQTVSSTNRFIWIIWITEIDTVHGGKAIGNHLRATFKKI